MTLKQWYPPVRLAMFAALVLAVLVMAGQLKGQDGSPPIAPEAGAAQGEAVREASPGWVHQVFGPAMSPLWLCSIVLLAVIINRFRALKRGRVINLKMVETVRRQMGELKVLDAIDTASRSRTLVGRAWANALREYQLGGVSLNGVLSDASSVVLKPLRRHLWLITTIGVIAPMFGLIGTVIGMIITFSTLAETGGADKAKLAVGLSFALYKTAGGLIVAIPAIIFGRYFSARVMAYAEEVEERIQSVCYEHSHGLARQERTPVEALSAGPQADAAAAEVSR